jgi:hypothetical protein
MYVVYINVYDIQNMYMFFVGEINAYMQVYLCLNMYFPSLSYKVLDFNYIDIVI